MSNVSTFSAFTTARLGIYSSQKNMEVVGNNISNINTQGYTRQVLNQKSIFMGGSDRYLAKSDVTVGTGARCTSVSQLRDPYLDIRYRNEMANVGAMDAKLSGLEQLTSIFDEVGAGTDGEGVMEAQFNELVEQLQNLSTLGAGKDEYDTLVRGAASSLTALFNTYADKLETLQENQDTYFRQDIDTVNDILNSIQTLNESIRKSEVHGSDALELKDQRNLLIDQLSQYIRIDVTYEQDQLGGGEYVDRLVIKMAGGDPNSDTKNATLVDGQYVTQFSITQVDDGAGNMVESENLAMSIAELTDKNGKVKTGSEAHDLTDIDLYGSLQSMREILTEKGEYATSEETAADPKAATKRGIPYYINQLNALANKFATLMNNANQLPDATVYKTDGSGAFLDANGIVTTDRTEYVLKDEYSYYNGGNLFSNNGNGDSTDPEITAANISISASWANGTVRMLQSTQPHTVTQSTDNSNIAHILSLIDSDQSYTPGDITAGLNSASKDTPMFTGSFQEMLGDISSTLANDVKTTTAMLENYTAASDELYVSRESVTGVDLNDEAVGMMQYQKSYSAACRMLTTLDSMLDKLINGTGIT